MNFLKKRNELNRFPKPLSHWLLRREYDGGPGALYESFSVEGAPYHARKRAEIFFVHPLEKILCPPPKNPYFDKLTD